MMVRLAWTLLAVVAALVTVGAWGFAPAYRFPCVERKSRTALCAEGGGGGGGRGGDPLDESNGEGFTRKQVLRAEAENPFRKFRGFIYAGLASAAVVGTLVTGTSLLALEFGRRPDLQSDVLYQNLAINIGGIVGLLFLLKRDQDAEQRTLQRIAQGGKLANLLVKLSSYSGLVGGEEGAENMELTQVMKLADFRKNRGYEKNVLLLIGSQEQLGQSVASSLPLSKSLLQNQCLLVPLVMDPTTLSLSALDTAGQAAAMPHVGTPIGLSAWNDVVGREMEAASKQSSGALADKGITLLLKQNGKIGKRKFGLPVFEAKGSSTTGEDVVGGFDISSIFY